MTSSIKFIDANVFVHRWDDPRIEEFINSLHRDHYCTSVLVLIETYYKLKQKNFTKVFEYIRSIMGTITVYDTTQEDLFNAMKSSLDVNINDKVHIATMKRNNITSIVSFDTDFDKDKGIVREEV